MKILEDLNIKTNNIELYEQAFTHTSFANENQLESYERLEFLGDAVLELVMSEYLYKNTDYDEGTMTKTRSHYVCETALYEYSLNLKLNEYLKLGRGEEENGGKYRKAIVADVFEALTGAIFLDQGIEKAKQFIYDATIPFIKDKDALVFEDYKSKLQELVQTDKRSLKYILIAEEGPPHNKTFTVNVKIDDIIYGIGTAHSKKEAEQNAAKDALLKSVEG
ncbi:MAG: ribonuclease III [Bacilli bacterium]